MHEDEDDKGLESDLFVCDGMGDVTPGEEYHVRIMLVLSAMQKEHGVAWGLETARAMMQAAADWTQLNIGPVAAHELLSTIANEKWRSMLAARKRRAA